MGFMSTKKRNEVATVDDGPDLDRFDEVDEENKEKSGGAGPRIFRVFLSVLTFASFLGILWYAYSQGIQAGKDGSQAKRGNVPLVTAPKTEAKVRPTDPGGLDVPHRDKRVYDSLEKRRSSNSAPGKSDLRDKPPSAMTKKAELDRFTYKTGKTPEPTPFVDPAKPADKTTPEPFVAPDVTTPRPTDPVTRAPTNPGSGDKAMAAKPTTKPKPDAKQTADLIGPYRIQLGAYRSQRQVMRSWTRLQKRNRDLLGKLGLIIEKVNLGRKKGVFYRMQAGPLQSPKAVKRLCGKLSKRRVPCRLVKT